MGKVFLAIDKRRVKVSNNQQEGYSMIAANIPHFQMAMKLHPARSDEGCAIEESLGERNPKYHQSCLCFSTS